MFWSCYHSTISFCCCHTALSFCCSMYPYTAIYPSFTPISAAVTHSSSGCSSSRFRWGLWLHWSLMQWKMVGDGHKGCCSLVTGALVGGVGAWDVPPGVRTKRAGLSSQEFRLTSSSSPCVYVLSCYFIVCKIVSRMYLALTDFILQTDFWLPFWGWKIITCRVDSQTLSSVQYEPRNTARWHYLSSRNLLIYHCMKVNWDCRGIWVH